MIARELRAEVRRHVVGDLIPPTFRRLVNKLLDELDANEAKAAANGTTERPTVLLTRHDVLSILTGTKMGCSLMPPGAQPAAGQEEIWVRLFTADEFLTANRSANEYYASMGVPSQPAPSRKMIEDIVAPVPEHMVWPPR